MSTIEDKILIKGEKLELILKRICLQLIENYGDFENTCIIGIQPRGSIFSDILIHILKNTYNIKNIEYGKLDCTFYRDDFRSRGKPLVASSMEMDFLIDNKKVILIDDVLYTGRTINAAMAALQPFGRPTSIELACLVDRHFNRDLPIQPDYTGLTLDTVDKSHVKVGYQDDLTIDKILLLPNK